METKNNEQVPIEQLAAQDIFQKLLNKEIKVNSTFSFELYPAHHIIDKVFTFHLNPDLPKDEALKEIEEHKKNLVFYYEYYRKEYIISKLKNINQTIKESIKNRHLINV